MRDRLVNLGITIAMLGALFAGITDLAPRQARAATSIAQTYYTPFEAQQFIDVLRGISGDPGCCSTSVRSTVSITSGADANTVVYDHFEDGYEADPFNPVQGSTMTLTLDAGDVWTQDSTIPIDGPGRGAGNYYDGRDKIISTAPIAVTQSGFATDPGTVHAGAVQVLDLDKSGLRFDIPIGEDEDYNSLFEYVGLFVIATEDGTTVNIDADANGSFEITASLDEGEAHIVDGGVNLGAVVTADFPVAAYVASGDIGATYEGRFVELYPTDIWSDAMVSPVGSHDTADGRTRAFLFNPNGSSITVDIVTGSGSTATLNIAAGEQESFELPRDQGAHFESRGGEPFYGMQMSTSEGSSTEAWDWGYTLIPEAAVTPSVIIPYGIGSDSGTHNYSPVWFAADADNTRVYVDLDGDPATGSETDPNGDNYDFHCDVDAFESWNAYDDGQDQCYRPSQDSNLTGGDRDMTGARLYALNGARISAAWGQRPDYIGGTPALDMGTTILPFPTISLAKTSVISVDADGDGLADAGDEVTYTMTMTNLGIVDVGSVVLTDDDPVHSAYKPNSTTLDATPQADDGLPFSASPLDTDSPAGGLPVGTLPAGSTRIAVFTVVVDDPLALGAQTLDNLAVMTTDYGPSSASVTDPLDVPPLQIDKTSAPSASPVGSGDTIDYTIRVFAADQAAQTGVTVTDTLPAGTTYAAGSVAADVDGTPVPASAPPVLVSGLTMNPGDLLTITFTADATAPLPAGITEFLNNAAASSTEFPTPVEDDATDPAAPEADMWVLKDDNTAVPLDSGDRFTYTLDVGNLGPDDAAAVTVVDTLPADVTFNAGLSDPSCAEAPAGTITCSLGSMAAGATTSLDIVVDIDGGFVGSLVNLVVVSSPTPDPDPDNNDDTEITPVEALPSITVSKTPSTGSVPEPGGTVTFSVEVANTSAEDLTLTSLTDDVFGNLLDPANPAISGNDCDDQSTTIGAGGTFACSFDAALAGDANDPDHVDTVSAAATDGEGNTATDDDSATVAFTDVPPTITVSKTPSAGSVIETGGTITFSIDVANTSAEAVTLTSLTDDVFGDLLDPANPAISSNDCDDQPTGIGVGGTFSCSFDAFLSGDAGGPDHVNTATAVVVDDDGTTGTDDDTATVTYLDALPSIAVTKTPSVGTVPEPGGTVTFTVEVENTSDEDLTLTSLTDDVFGNLLDPANPAISNNDCDDQATAIAVGGTFACSFDAALSGFAGGPDHTNTVTATAEDDEANPVSDNDSASVSFGDVPPTITTTKTPSAGSVPEPGGTVTFVVEVENTSVEDLTLTSLTDDVFGDLLDPANPAISNNDCDDQATGIGIGGTFTCSFDAALVGLAGDPDHVNTVTAVVDDGEGNTATDDGSATVSYGDSLPSISVTKTPSVGSVPETGGTVTFTVDVENTSAEPITLTSLTDDVFGNLLDPANPAISNNDCDDQATAIAVGGTFSCSFDAALAGDASGPDHVNIVSATADDGEGNTANGSDSANVGFDDELPSIAVTKAPSAGSVTEPGGTITFSVDVTNTSGEALTLTALTDDVFGNLLDPTNPAISNNDCDDQATGIGIGGTFTCSFDAALSGLAGDPDHIDTVTATAIDNEANPATDDDSATVSFVDAPPTIDVTKTPSAGSVPEPGGTVTFTVDVANTSAEAVTLIALTDDVFGDLLDPANPAVSNNDCDDRATAIGIGGTFTCSFDAALSGLAGDPDHVNTVTATVDDGEGNNAQDSDDATVSYADSIPSIDVTKTPSVGSVPEPGGTVTFTVEVENLSPEPLTLSSLTDDVFGDLLDPANPAISSNDCDDQSTAIVVGSTFSCSFDAALVGDASGPDHSNTVTGEAGDGEGNTVSDTDSATVAFTDVPPTVTTTKTPAVASIDEPGGTVEFFVEVANTSVEPITLTGLTDDVFGDLLDPGNPALVSNDCPTEPRAIGIGGTFTCSFEADLVGNASGPDHTNTVTATAQDGEGNPATDDDPATVPFDDVLPTISITKTALPDTVAEPGGTVTFLIEVANTSVETVTLTSLTDDVFGNLLDPANPAVSNNDCDDQASAIAVGGTFTCTFDVTLSGFAGGPDHVNTVTATADDDEGNTATDDATETVTFTDTLPTISVTKTPSAGALPEPGGTVTFSVEVTNTSVEAVTLASLTDDVFGDLLDPANPAVSSNDCDDQATAIGVGATFSCSFDAALIGNAAGPDHLNTVTAAAGDGEGNTAFSSDDASVSFTDVLPTISVTKTPSAGSVSEPGGTITFSVEVANTSVEPVTLISLTDDVFGDLLDPANPAISNNDCDDQAALIGIGGTLACSFDASLVGLAGDPDHVNTVTAGAVDDEGNPATGDDDAVVVFGDDVPSISVAKTPSVGSVPEPGGTVIFTVEVGNLSQEPLTLTSLTDDVFGNLLDPANPAISSNDCDDQATAIAVGGTFTCSFEGLVAGLAGDPGHLNTVTANADDGEGNIAEDSDDAAVAFTDIPPTIDVTKTPSVGSVPEPGGTVTFTVEVANTSVEPITLIDLTDDVFGDLLDPANPAVSNNDCDDTAAVIPVSGAFTCSFDGAVTGNHGDPDHVNVVTATVDDGDGNTAEDSDDATVSYEAAFGGLTGHLWVDYDGDGIQGPDEPNLPGVDVVIVDEAGTEFRVTSDANGNWAQTVALGSATFAVDPATVPAGYLLTTANAAQAITVPVGGIASEPIGYRPEPASVSGSVWVDLDLDLARTAPEPPLGDVTIRLLDDGGNVVATTTTAADGTYSFDGLIPGDYTIEIDQGTVPAGYELAADPDGDTSGDTAISLAPGEHLTDRDFIEQGTGSIGDLVWLDEDADGVQDLDEEPMANITVNLTWAGPDGEFGTDDDWEYPSKVTGSDGLYRFTNLPPGEFRGSVDLDTVGQGMSATTPPSYQITLPPGEDFDDGDIGFAPGEDPLPQTGIDADRIGLAAVMFLLLGLALLLIGRELDHRRRRQLPFDRLAR